MPSDGRKSIAIPVETYEHFIEVHEASRPNERTPHWYTLNMLLDLHQESVQDN